MALPRLPEPFNTENPGPGFASVPLKLDNKVMSHELNSGDRAVVRIKNGTWSFDLVYTDLMGYELEPLIPFLYSLNGPYQKFTVLLPQFRYPKNGATGLTETASSTVAVSSNVLAGSRTLTLNNWDAVGDGSELRPMDMFKIKGKPKMYSIESTSYSAGQLTINFNPALAEDLVAGTDTIVTDEPLFTVRLKNTDVRTTLMPDMYYTAQTFQVEEAAASTIT